MDPNNSLLNAMDGVARYEAHQELIRRGDPVETVSRLKRMLDDGTARYPHEIVGLLYEIGGSAAVEDLIVHPNRAIRYAAERALAPQNDILYVSPTAPTKPSPPRARLRAMLRPKSGSPPPVEPSPEAQSEPESEPLSPQEMTLEYQIAGWVQWIGSPLKSNEARSRRAYQKLVEAGEPAISALVERLHYHAATHQRYSILQALGEIAESGVPAAREALVVACEDREPGIAHPARVILDKLDGNI
ncbi:MAG: hypothetical protein JXQ72_13040 [Anaerolineae bacterium]|nr:hypothetical protein [Anaerolineae bacterium]